MNILLSIIIVMVQCFSVVGGGGTSFDVPRVVDVKWDGVNDEVVFSSLFSSGSVVPGDEKSQSLIVRNSSEFDGVVRVWLVNNTNGQRLNVNNGFYENVFLKWGGDGWSGSRSLKEVYSSPNNTIFMGSGVLNGNSDLRLDVGFLYPLNAPRFDEGGSVIDLGVVVQLGGNDDLRSLTLDGTYRLLDDDGDGLGDIGDSIEWFFTVRNNSSETISNVIVNSGYLGSVVKCPVPYIKPGEKMTCGVDSRVNAGDVLNKKIHLTAFATGLKDNKTRVASAPVVSIVPVDDSTPVYPSGYGELEKTDCAERGYNVRRGEPSYDPSLDLDNDGVICERGALIDENELKTSVVIYFIIGIILSITLGIILYIPAWFNRNNKAKKKDSLETPTNR